VCRVCLYGAAKAFGSASNLPLSPVRIAEIEVCGRVVGRPRQSLLVRLDGFVHHSERPEAETQQAVTPPLIWQGSQRAAS
jgi:hypothetical protein